MPEAVLVCEDCGYWEEDRYGRENVLVDEKRVEYNHAGSARLNARIHAAKTGHDPEVNRLEDPADG